MLLVSVYICFKLNMFVDSCLVFMLFDFVFQSVHPSCVIVEVSENEDSKKLFRYKAKLILINASYVETGFYYCHQEDKAYDNKITSKKIYIYVRGWLDVNTVFFSFNYVKSFR